MKTLSQFQILSLLTLLCTSLIMPVHAEDKVMDMDRLEVKNELRYMPEQAHPFTGNAVSYFANGMQKLQASFRNGLKHGKEIAWYEDGQLRYVVRYLNGEPQSVGSAWYARSSQADVAVSTLQFCDEDDMRIGFCDSGVQESSRIEFTEKQESSRLDFTP